MLPIKVISLKKRKRKTERSRFKEKYQKFVKKKGYNIETKFLSQC